MGGGDFVALPPVTSSRWPCGRTLPYQATRGIRAIGSGIIVHRSPHSEYTPSHLLPVIIHLETSTSRRMRKPMMTMFNNYYLESLPFESYPDQGRRLLGRVSGGNCRHSYGLKFMRLTRLTKCAYCGIDLGEVYESWLNMALDHVIPHNTCQAWQVPEEWREDYSNRVLSCTTCNTFGNRYSPHNMNPPSTLEEFYNLRDIIFIERKRLILEKHKQERVFFEKKLWETHSSIN